MSFVNFLPDDYYKRSIVKEFNENNNNIIDNSSPLYLRNIPTKYRLTLNHIEVIEFFTRLLRPKNYLELGVQFGEATRRIIPNILETYYAVDMERSSNIDYFYQNYKNFKFYQQTTDSFFEDMKANNINLNLEMAFIDACHSHEASYKDFLNVKDHLVNDGIIFFHDTYPKDFESTASHLSGDCYKTAEKIRKEHSDEFEIVTIPVEPGLSIVRKINRQLNWLDNKKTVGFIIPTCLRSNEHFVAFCKCIQSIKQHNPENRIVVICDFTNDSELEKKAIETFPDVLFERNTEMVPADMLVLSYYKDKKYFDKAVVLQDSMRLKTHIDASNVNDVQYIWHFTNHRHHWSKIQEPETDFNKINKIITHDDLNYYVINNIVKMREFRDYCNKTYPNKNDWCGCFGTCLIISYNFLRELDSKTQIINIQKQMTSNRLRRSIESILSLACQFVTCRNMENGCDGLYYDGINPSRLDGEKICKESFNRL